MLEVLLLSLSEAAGVIWGQSQLWEQQQQQLALAELTTAQPVMITTKFTAQGEERDQTHRLYKDQTVNTLNTEGQHRLLFSDSEQELIKVTEL